AQPNAAEQPPNEASPLALVDAIERLVALRTQGAISAEEFGLAKARLLGENGGSLPESDGE
ncbi:MAG: SHOCT domain-containing protein, partial [Acidobacteriota bacterium]